MTFPMSDRNLRAYFFATVISAVGGVVTAPWASAHPVSTQREAPVQQTADLQRLACDPKPEDEADPALHVKMWFMSRVAVPVGQCHGTKGTLDTRPRHKEAGRDRQY